MDKEFKQFTRSLQSIKLSQKEKEISRARMIDFMKQHPVAAHAVRKQNSLRLSQKRSTFFTRKKYTLMPITLIIAILLGGSVSYAAEGALPGDTLYPIKVTVNEGMQNLLAVSTESKAKLHVELANERLKEAETLAVENRLNTETQAKVEAQFQAHTEKVQKLVEKIEENDGDNTHVATQVHTNLESVLSAHEDVLVRIKDRSEGEDESRALASLILNVKAQGEVASTTGIKLQTTLTAQTNERLQKSAEGKKKSAQNKIEEVVKFVGKVEGSMSAEIKAQVDARINAANESLVAGDVYWANGTYLDAFNAYQNTIKLAQEAKLIAEIEKELKVSSEERAKVKSAERNNRSRSDDNERNDRNDVEEDGQKSEIRTRVETNTDNRGKINVEVKTGTSSSSNNDEDSDETRDEEENEDEQEVEAKIKVNVGSTTNVNVGGGIQ